MKRTILVFFIALITMSFTSNINATRKTIATEVLSEKFDIKIKNDTDNVVKVINDGSGGSYSLTKGATTTIKMEEGEKLYYYEKGKKGDLILTATKEMDGKVQLLSKL